ncbi:MAG: SMC-Scp complex subunit ScpB [Bdellovibrionota bacterium]
MGTKKNRSDKLGTKFSTAAADWKPDPENNGPSTFIQDPFGIRSSDIASDQASDEPLDLDEPLEEEELPNDDIATSSADSDALLDRIQGRINDVTSLAQEEITITSAQNALTAAERLSAEIAEDEALARLLAEEADTKIDPAIQSALHQDTPSLDAATEISPADELDVNETSSAIEALLFITDRPVSRDKLRTMLGEQVSAFRFQEAVDAMRVRYENPACGIELVEVAGGFQLRTKPAKAVFAKKLAKTQTQRLSSGALETLAIIAYKQPILKEEVDRIRGVDSSHFVRGLMEKNLVRMEGRSDLPGRPIIYATTPQFLELFGLRDLESMPPLHELESMIPTSEASGQDADEAEVDPKLRELRRLVGQMNSDPTRLTYDEREDDRILSDIRARVKNAATSTPSLLEAELAAKAATQPKEELIVEPELPTGVTPTAVPTPAIQSLDPGPIEI